MCCCCYYYYYYYFAKTNLERVYTNIRDSENLREDIFIEKICEIFQKKKLQSKIIFRNKKLRHKILRKDIIFLNKKYKIFLNLILLLSILFIFDYFNKE